MVYQLDQDKANEIIMVHPLCVRNKHEFDCVVDAMTTYRKRDVDILGIIVAMHKLGYINKHAREQLIDKYSDILQDLSEFVMDILRLVTFEKFCFLLESEGYKDMTASMRRKMFAMLYVKLPKKDMPHSKRTHDYYKTMKTCIDNKKLGGDVRQRLRTIIEKQNVTIMSKDDMDLTNKEFAIERKAAALVLLIQQHKDVDERKAILEGVYRQETNGLDKSTLEIIYHSKMAMTEAQAGNVSEAEAHIAQAKILCENCGPSFAVTSALHDIEYTYRVLHSKNPSEELLEKVLSEGEVALQSLQEERDDVQKLWQRILLLFMVLALLNINGDFEVGDARKLTKSHKKRAKYLLKEIKRHSGSMELRRTMVMCIGLAVLHEDNDNDAAESYAKQALAAAKQGSKIDRTARKNPHDRPHARDIKARNIVACDIDSRDSNARDIDVRNIDACDFDSRDTDACDIDSCDIKARDIHVCDQHNIYIHAPK